MTLISEEIKQLPEDKQGKTTEVSTVKIDNSKARYSVLYT